MSAQRPRFSISALVITVVAAVIALSVGAPSRASAADDVGNLWFQSTGPLSSGVIRSSAIDTVGDVDWYYFYNSATAEVKVGANKTSGNDSRVTVYRWDGGKLVEQGQTFTQSGTPLALAWPAGLYYVNVQGYSSGYTGGYDLTLTGNNVETSPPAGVQTSPQAIPITEDNTTDWTGATGPLTPTRPYIAAINTVGDADWYYFYNSATAEVKVGANKTSGNDSRVTVYRWDAGKLVEQGQTFTQSGTPLALAWPAGLYYVNVQGYSSGYTGGYDLTLTGSQVTSTPPPAPPVVVTPPAPPVVVTPPAPPVVVTPPVASTKYPTLRVWSYKKASRLELDVDPNLGFEWKVRLQKLKANGQWKNASKVKTTIKTHRKFNPTKGTYRVVVYGKNGYSTSASSSIWIKK